MLPSRRWSSREVAIACCQVRLRPQASVDSADSRASKVSGVPSLAASAPGEEGRPALVGEVVAGLQGGLARVRPPAIGEWNLHKHVRGDRELRPIVIPF